MSSDIYEKIRANPKYLQLKQTRNTYGWVMTALMLVVYYGYTPSMKRKAISRMEKLLTPSGAC